MFSIKNHSFMPHVKGFYDDDWSNYFNWKKKYGFGNVSTPNTPAVNIHEKEKAYSIDVAAPGLKKEDFKVEVNDSVLKISSESKDVNMEDEKGFSRKEFHYGSFERSFSLDDKSIHKDKIKAKYTDGILKVTIPKREEEKQQATRLIDIA